MFNPDFICTNPQWTFLVSDSDSLYEVPLNGTFGGSIGQPLYLIRGQDVTFRLTMRNRAGTVQNVSNWEFLFKVFKRATPANMTLTQNNTFFQVDDASNGNFSMNLAESATSNITVGEYVYEFWRNQNGQRYTVAYGDLTIKA